MLLGRAYSNVFDGQRVIGDEVSNASKETGLDEGENMEGKGDRIVLTGVPARGKVGLLTLFEAYKHVEVGEGRGVGFCAYIRVGGTPHMIPT